MRDTGETLFGLPVFEAEDVPLGEIVLGPPLVNLKPIAISAARVLELTRMINRVSEDTALYTWWAMNPEAYREITWAIRLPEIRRAYRKLGRGRNQGEMKQWWFAGSVKEL